MYVDERRADYRRNLLLCFEGVSMRCHTTYSILYDNLGSTAENVLKSNTASNIIRISPYKSVELLCGDRARVFNVPFLSATASQDTTVSTKKCLGECFVYSRDVLC